MSELGVGGLRVYSVLYQQDHAMSMFPDEVLLSLTDTILCRDLQIRQLSALLAVPFPSTLILHGAKATGKCLTISAILNAIGTPSAVVPSQECITTRHLLERSIISIQDAFPEYGTDVDESVANRRCESISAFVVELQLLFEGRGRFILVFDGIDRQRDAAPTLLPAMTRLGEMVCRRPRFPEVPKLTDPRSQTSPSSS